MTKSPNKYKKHRGRHVWEYGGGEKDLWHHVFDKKSQLGTIHIIKLCKKCGVEREEYTVIGIVR